MALFGGHPTLANGLKSAHTLDETSGQRKDSHGAYHLTQINGVGFTPGKNGNAARFVAGSLQYLKIDTVDFRMSGDFSVALWLYHVAAQPAGQAERWGYWRLSDFSFDYHCFRPPFSNALTFRIADSVAGSAVATTGALSTDAWHLVIAVYDSVTKQATLHVDNAGGVTSAALTNGPRQAGTQLLMGDASNLNSVDLDAPLLYTRKLTAQERTDLWAGGAGLFYGLPVEIARFRFDREGRPDVSRPAGLTLGSSRLTNVALMTGQGIDP